MATEHGMIEPFVERQIRGAGDAPVISYGVSSYGYDVRCADEFKVWTRNMAAPHALDAKDVAILVALLEIGRAHV